MLVLGSRSAVAGRRRGQRQEQPQQGLCRGGCARGGAMKAKGSRRRVERELLAMRDEAQQQASGGAYRSSSHRDRGASRKQQGGLLLCAKGGRNREPVDGWYNR